MKAEVKTTKTYCIELDAEEYRIISSALWCADEDDTPGSQDMYVKWTAIK